MRIERNFWTYLSKAMGKLWDAQRHEDKLTCGIPDVSYAIEGQSGWIELKCLEKWPSSNIIVRVPHLTPYQKLWLFLRGNHGHAFLFLKVDRDYLLFDGRDIMEVGKVKKDDLIRLSTFHSKGFEKDGFIRAISQPYERRKTKNLEDENR
jgi:hypothetical protein